MPVPMAWSTPGRGAAGRRRRARRRVRRRRGRLRRGGRALPADRAGAPARRAGSARSRPALANAMLAGVLLGLCVEPFRALADEPAADRAGAAHLAGAAARGPAVGGARRVRAPRSWSSWSPARWRTCRPTTGAAPDLDHARPRPARPCVAIGVPLYLVTMTSQNIPGVAVLASFGYRAPLRPRARLRRRRHGRDRRGSAATRSTWPRSPPPSPPARRPTPTRRGAGSRR